MSDHIRSNTSFRPDLEGLRGIAILLVIACHAALPLAGAGFIGVDVFFVLSGFLITGLLIAETDRTGRIDLAAFYARRARRILPAAAVVLVTTLAAATLILSPLDLPRISSDALAAALSVANLRFALSSTDYFAPIDPSPVLHFWSLSVEEQFYLAWPALVLIGARLRRPRLGITTICGLVLVGSLALSIWLTAVSGPWAYYAIPTRAWQLAAGGALALAVRSPGRLPGAIAAPLGWLGALLLVASLLLIGPLTPYPGAAAAVPTLGTLALIAAGPSAGSPGSLVLRRAPLRWMGRISYSLYLWHWPILVLGATAASAYDPEIDGPYGRLTLNLGLVAIAVCVAAVSWRLIEEPFRVGRLSRGGHRRSLATAVAAVMAFTIGSTAMGVLVQRDVAAAELGSAEVDPGNASEDAWRPGRDDRPIVLDPDTLTPSGPTPSPSASPSPTASPVATPEPSAAPSPTPKPPKARIAGPVPGGLAPSLSAAHDDDDGLIKDGCGLGIGGSEPPICAYGDAHGAVTVALVGDSHAMSWFPAMERLAVKHGWRLVPFTKYSCVFVDMPIWSPYLGREYTECGRWRERVVARLRQIKPDVVVITGARWFPTVNDADDDPIRQGAAVARLVERIPGRVAILVDTPRSEFDVPACLARHSEAIEACTTRRATAFTWRHRRREREAVKRSDAKLIDLSDATCPTDPCPPIIGKRLVYRDHHHLTATFAASLAPALDVALAPLVTP
ncbi:MAG TPA: acyltransferase family protein [Candidatus Limnocylindrales bacterium]|nr:acyltransferase family protein [Candidatus Limnocylindrales bacterium]